MPLVLVNLRLGLALWVPLIFLQGVPALNLGSKAAGLLIVVAWIGNLRSMRGDGSSPSCAGTGGCSSPSPA